MSLSSFLPPMKTRSTDPELMDLAACDPQLLAATIRQFGMINRWFSAYRGLIRRCFFSLMESDTSRPYTLLDIGAGGGDIDVWMVQEARRRKIRIEITAVDYDERVMTTAREIVAGYPEITLRLADAHDLAVLGTFDFIFCNHLLHHLTAPQIGSLLCGIERGSKIAYLLNDLERSRRAYFGYTLMSALFFPGSLAFHDGRLSIRKGFTGAELRELVNRFLTGVPVTVLRAFPSRLALYRCKS